MHINNVLNNFENFNPTVKFKKYISSKTLLNNITFDKISLI